MAVTNASYLVNISEFNCIFHLFVVLYISLKCIVTRAQTGVRFKGLIDDYKRCIMPNNYYNFQSTFCLIDQNNFFVNNKVN